MTDIEHYANKIWCACGKEYYVSKFDPRSFEEAVLYSQGYNDGLRKTYEKVMKLMYDWGLEGEQRDLISSDMKDLVTLDMPVATPECKCPEEETND